MFNNFLGDDIVKRISHQFTFFYKNIFPFFVGFICIIVGVVSFVGKNYLFLIFAFAVFIVLAVAMMMAYKMKIADEVYLDYKNREFVFIYKKEKKDIRRNFKDLTSIRKMAMGQTIEIIFDGGEKYFFYSSQNLGPLPNNSVYQELKFILDNRMGEFLTE